MFMGHGKKKGKEHEVDDIGVCKRDVITKVIDEISPIQFSNRVHGLIE
ncbi:hypothetical protein Gotri_015121, partial [Gossypium trilobum]|nr:hypothetical protein [Gossypium trilobum]